MRSGIFQRSALFVLPCAVGLLLGCSGPQQAEVVVYTAHDREFSKPILDEFQQESGVNVLPKFDVESTKTVGLVNELIQQQGSPRGDVFWNNEILHTLRLEKLGLLDSYELPWADKFPAGFRSADGKWYGFAARARVLIVNTTIVPAEERPDSIQSLVDPKWKGKVGIARPLFGTTATHAAVLFATWGDEQAKEFFQQVKENAVVVSGNKQVAQDVASGKLAFGITDTDDAVIERDRGAPVEIVFPDQGEGQLGTLLIPNTVCIIKGGPNPQQARKLVEHLLSAEVERQLAEGPSAQFPLNSDVTVQPRVAPQQPLKRMEADFAAAAEKWDAAAEFLAERF
jgi:iron(III) transport system substrate-binding protein